MPTESYEYAYNEHIPGYEPSWVVIRGEGWSEEFIRERAEIFRDKMGVMVRRRKVVRSDWEEF